MATVDRNSQKHRKRKGTEKSSRKDSASSKRRKHSHAKPSTSEEVVTMDKSEIDEHTRLLLSVTGKMERLPQHEDGSDDEKVEGGTKGGAKGITKERPADAGEGREEGPGVDKEAAAQYLTLWNSRRDRWTFRKKTQYWLLQNMYDKKEVSKANFKLMLLYLNGLRGNQRELAKERAEKMIAKNHSDKESKIEYKRACKVLRILTEQ